MQDGNVGMSCFIYKGVWSGNYARGWGGNKKLKKETQDYVVCLYYYLINKTQLNSQKVWFCRKLYFKLDYLVAFRDISESSRDVECYLPTIHRLILGIKLCYLLLWQPGQSQGSIITRWRSAKTAFRKALSSL